VYGKGAKERMVRFGKATQRALYVNLRARKDNHDCLWVTDERRPMTADGIQSLIKRLCARAKIMDAKPGPHTFRHTFAIRAFMNGAREFEVQALLGHSSLEMTRRYMSSLNSELAGEAHHRFSPVDRLGIK